MPQLRRWSPFVVLAAFSLFLCHGALGQGIVTGTGLVRHALSINGTVEGSLHQQLGEDLNLNGGATITNDLLVPGTPNVRINGQPNFGGTIVGSGSTSPSNYQIMLNGNSRLGKLRTRTNAVSPWPSVSAPLSPTGSRSVNINSSGQSPAPWNTLRNLTLNGNVGQMSVPPGRYGDFIAGAGAGFTLGVVGSTTPAVYHFQRLTLNGQSHVEIVGPVEIYLANSLALNGHAGTSQYPAWLRLHVSNGGVTLNGGGAFYGYVHAPNNNSTVIINGNAELSGGVVCDRLTVNGGGLLRLWEATGGGGNQAPVANNFALNVQEDVALPFSLQGTDPDNGTLTYTIVSAPQHGTLTGGTGAPRTYTPVANYFGSDSFTYKVGDGAAESAVATVTITIAPVNDAPSAFNQSARVAENGSTSLQLTGSDVENSPLTFAWSSPAHGTITGNAATGAIVYTPSINYTGADSFTFTVNDGTASSAPATVTLDVTPLPRATPLNTQTNEDQPVAISLSGTGGAGAALSFNVVSQPTHGTLSGTAPNLLYTPNPNYFGQDTFTYTATDGASTSAASVITITVVPVNDAPTLAAIPPQITPEDTALDVPLSATDIDTPSGQITFAIIDLPAHGIATVVGSVVHYEPAPNYYGNDTFTVQASDGSLTSEVRAVAITVTPVNDAPIALAQSRETNEDQPLAIVLSGLDADGDVFAYTITEAPAHGTLTGTAPDLVYMPALNFNGNDRFSFLVSDGVENSPVAHINISVVPINDPPIVQAGPDVIVDEGATVSLQGSVSDIELDGAHMLPFTWTLVSGPGNLTFSQGNLQTPVGYVVPGTYIVRLTVVDGEHTISDDLTITIRPNTPPMVNAGIDFEVVAPAELSLTGTVNDDGLPVGGSLLSQWSLFSGPAGVTISPAGVSAAKVLYSAPGLYVFRLSASDGQLLTTDDVSVQVIAPNFPPDVNAGGDQLVLKPLSSSTTQTILSGVVSNPDQRPMGGQLTQEWTLISGPGLVQFENAFAAVTAATFTAEGTYVLRLRGSDGELSAQDDLSIVVSPANAAPLVNAGGDVAIHLGESVTLVGTVNDDDIPKGVGLQTNWSISSGVIANPQALNTAVTFSSPGTYVARLTVSDSELSSYDEVVVTVTLPPNRAPVVDAGRDITVNQLAGTVLYGTVTDDGYPVPASLLSTWEMVSGPAPVTFGQPNDTRSNVSFGRTGEYVLRLSATDGELSANDEIRVNVQAVNRPPLVSIESVTSVYEAEPLTLKGIVADDGLPTDTVTAHWSKVGGPGTVNFANSASAHTEATFTQAGIYTLKLVASDGELSTEATCEVKVLNETCAYPAGLIALWKGEDSFEESVSGLQTTPSNVGFAAGKNGRGFQFPAAPTLSSLSVPAVVGLTDVADSLTGFAIAMWIKADSIATWNELWGWTSDLVEGYISPNGGIWSEAGNSYTTATGLVKVGQWHHITFSFDAVTRIGRLYLDGVQIHQGTYSPTPSMTRGILTFGGGNIYQFRGVMDDIALFRKPISATDVERIRMNGFQSDCEYSANLAPVVDAGPDLNIPVSYIPNMQGVVTDDGNPSNTVMDLTWTKVSGPGTVVFQDASKHDTAVTFGAVGAYILRLTANDGEQQAWDEVKVTVFRDDVQIPDEVVLLPYFSEWRYKVYKGIPVPNEVGRFDFNDSDYQLGKGSFGSGGGCPVQQHVKTNWPVNSSIVLRRNVQLEGDVRNVRVVGTVDNNVRVFINETDLGWVNHSNCATLDDTRINATASTILRPGGDNLFVIWGYDYGAEAFLDAKIVVDQPIVAHAGNAQIVPSQSEVMLDGSGSIAISDRPLTYQWKQVQGPAVVFNLDDPVHPRFVAPMSLGYTEMKFQLIVSDGRVVSEPAFVEVDVLAGPFGNAPPSVFAGIDRTLTNAFETTLTGTMSDDGIPSGFPVQSFWYQLSGPGEAKFGAPTQLQSRVSFARPGVYLLRLFANDGVAQAYDDVQITVVSTATGVNQPPIVNAGPDTTAVVGVPFTLTPLISDDGLPNQSLVTRCVIVSGRGQVALQAAGPSFELTFHYPGAYVLEVTATDSLFTVSDRVVVQVTGVGQNQIPSLQLGPDQTVPYGEIAILHPQIADDGLPSGYVEWSIEQTDGPSGITMLESADDTVRLSFPQAGVYRIRGVVSDGALQSSDEVEITVTASSTQPSQVDVQGIGAGEEFIQGQPPQVIVQTLDPDAGGGIVRVEIYINGVLSEVLLPKAGELPPSLVGAIDLGDLGPGQHVITITVTDASGTPSSGPPIPVNVVAQKPKLEIPYPKPYSAFGPSTIVNLQAVVTPYPGAPVIDVVQFFVNGVLVGSDSAAPYGVPWTTPGQPGDHSLIVRTIDVTGVPTESAPIPLRIVANPSAPTVVSMVAPLDSEIITAPTDVIGTVQCVDLVEWTLEYQRKGECQDWIVFGRGQQQRTDEALGVLDPTLLMNGMYNVRLTVRDSRGRRHIDEVSLTVEGGMKVGLFTLTFEDMNINLSGMPLSVTRTYDSRDHCPGDFGYGWKLDIDSIRLEKNAPVGDGWFLEAVVSFISPSYMYLADTIGHTATVKMPGGDILRFSPKAVMGPRTGGRMFGALIDDEGDDIGQIWAPITNGTPVKLIFKPRGGTHGATLAPLGYEAEDYWTGEKKVVQGNPILYIDNTADNILATEIDNDAEIGAPIVTDATGWELSMKDGRVFTFDARGRLRAMRDLDGNVLQIHRDTQDRVQGLEHSTGKRIDFIRNDQGYVTEALYRLVIGGEAVRMTRYEYDAAGNLVRFYDTAHSAPGQDASMRYTYKGATHLLEDLFDGKNVKVARSEYDASGRLTRTRDANGKETVFTHDIAGRTETIRDRANNVTVMRYDERGNVVETRAADGTITQTSYHVYSDGRKSDLKTEERVTGRFTNETTGALEQKTLITRYEYEDEDSATPPLNDGLLRKMTDPRGMVTRFTYDALGSLRTVTDPLLRTTTNTYYFTSFGDLTTRLESTTDAAGNVTRFTYSPLGSSHVDKETRTVTVTNASGASEVRTLVTDYDYNSSGWLLRVTDANGHGTSYTHDALGNVLTETTTRTVNGVVETLVTEHEYDAMDRLRKTWDPQYPRSAGHAPASESVYDANGKVVSTFDALRHETRMTYNDRAELIRTDYADGTFETVEYDSEGRREFATDRRGKTTQTVYDGVGRVAETWFLGDANDPDVCLSSMTYDGMGRVHTSTDARNHTSTTVYDKAGRRVKTINALQEVSANTYDDAGNLRFMTDARGFVTEHIYDALNRRVRTIYPAANVWNGAAYAETVTESVTEYDELGRRVAEIEQSPIGQPMAERRKTRYVYDNVGRLTHVVQPMVDGVVPVTSYSYDELGNQLTQTDALNRTTRYEYDKLGRRTKRILPGAQVESVAYDRLNTDTRTDFNGTITSYTYDTLNRLLSRTSNHVHAASSNVSFTYTASGQRATMTDVTGVTVYHYDERDRLETKETPQGTLGYSYDDAGNLTGIGTTSVDGASMTYGYDDLNRLDAVLDANGQRTDYEYNANGSLEQVRLPNHVVSTYAYSGVNRLEDLTHVNTQTMASVARYRYGVLPTGHRIRAEDSGQAYTLGGQPATRVATYGYDALWRLRSESIQNSVGANGQVGYVLDAVGNRASRTSTVPGLQTQSFTYDANDRVDGDSHDNNGNTITASISQPANAQVNPANPAHETNLIRGTDVYDAENRLISRTGPNGSVTFAYDGDGHRVRESITRGGLTTITTYLVDDLNPTGYAQVVEERTNGALTRVYTYGHDLISQDVLQGTDWKLVYFGYDGHGNVRFLTDQFGTITDTYDYDAFGQLIGQKVRNPGNGELEVLNGANSALATANDYLYCGERFTQSVGMVYLRARVMNPLTGRFWTTDSYEGGASDPQSLHKHLYVRANPINRVDPSGFLDTLSGVQTTALVASVARMAAQSAGRSAAKKAAEFLATTAAVLVGGTIAFINSSIAEFDREKYLSEARASIRRQVADLYREAGGAGSLLFHYTDETSAEAIASENRLNVMRKPWRNPYTGLLHPVAAYATDIAPWEPGMTQQNLAHVIYSNEKVADNRLNSGRLSHVVVILNREPWQWSHFSGREFIRMDPRIKVLGVVENAMPFK